MIRLDRAYACVASSAMAAALAVVLSSGSSQAVLPGRHRAFEHGTDMNELLPDAGRLRERKQRKADRRARLKDLQRAAVEGRP